MQEANSNWQLAVGQAEAFSTQQKEANSNWQLAVGQSEEPRPNPPVGDVLYPNEFNARQLEYFRRGYAINEYGTMAPPEFFRKEGEERFKNRLGLPYDMTNQQKLAEWHKRQLALLELAKEAPRCEHVFIDGTTCQSPRMKKHQYCYAHARMLEVRPKKLKLLPAEDENSIMWNIMEIQRALIDDEISEKKAGLLLYGQQLALIAVRGTTFKTTDPNQMVRVMPKTQNHTTDDTDGTDQRQGSKTEEPQRAGNRVIGGSGDRVIGNPENTKKVPGDELDKSLFSGDEGGGASDDHPNAPKPGAPGTPGDRKTKPPAEGGWATRTRIG